MVELVGGMNKFSFSDLKRSLNIKKFFLLEIKFFKRNYN